MFPMHQYNGKFSENSLMSTEQSVELFRMIERTLVMLSMHPYNAKIQKTY